MNDAQRTTIFGAVAAVLLVLTLITITDTYREPDGVSEQRGAFYPEFTDANKAASLEVIEWDSALSQVKQFRVEQQPDGLWVIPSHSNYPADAENRLARTAGRILGLKKDVMRSKDKKDHEKFGVVDPEELNVTEWDSRGKRVILRDRAGNTLADHIFGKKTDVGGNEMVYVRSPKDDTTYSVKSDAEITARFEDWIETDLLKLSASDIRKIVIDNYSINEDEGLIENRHTYFIARDGSSDPWKIGELKEDEEINTDTVFDMTNTLDDLKIVGVRRKPEMLRQGLKGGGLSVDTLTRILLQQKGYYLLPQRDPATQQVVGFQMVSNEGEIEAFCSDGVVYTLRFGEILVGTGDEISAGSEKEKKQRDPDKKKEEKKGGAEHRYLFVTARFETSLLGNPPSPPVVPEKKPGEKKEEGEKKEGEQAKKDPEQEKYEKEKEEYDRKKKEYDEKGEKGEKRTRELSDRFADWYYVINTESFNKLRKERKDLVKKKEKKEEEKKDEGAKPDGKKPEEKKPEEKKGEGAKPDGKKPEEKKPEEKKGEGAKPDGKKPEEKKPQEKKDEGAKPDGKKPGKGAPEKKAPEKKPE